MHWMWNKEKKRARKGYGKKFLQAQWFVLDIFSMLLPLDDLSVVLNKAHVAYAGLTCQAHFLHRLKWTCKQRCVKDPWFFTTVFLKFSRQKYRSIGCEGNRVPVFSGVFTKELSCNVRDCVEWLLFWWRWKTGGENYLFAGWNKTIWCSQKWVTSTILLSSHITAYIIEIKTTMLQQQGTGV